MANEKIKGKILIVDDVEVNRYLLASIFQDTYEIITANDGQAAIELIDKYKGKINAVLLDIIMPVMDGYDVLDYMKKKNNLRRIPVIMISGDKNQESELRCLQMGAVDFINKPFEPNIVTSRVNNAIDLYMHKNKLELLVSIQVNKLKELNDQIIDTLSSLVEFRDVESGLHIQRVKLLTEVLLRDVQDKYPEYNLSDHDIDLIKSASVLHDVGKITIPDRILLKPGKLTDDEYDIMKGHAYRGSEIIKSFKFIDNKEYFDHCYDICRHHHERYDGNGYPDGLVGDDISIGSQVVALADVYDALVSERVYKSAYKKETAYKMIIRGECGIFNPKLIKCFENCVADLQRVEEENADEIMEQEFD